MSWKSSSLTCTAGLLFMFRTKKTSGMGKRWPQPVCQRSKNDVPMNPYHRFVTESARLLHEAASYPLGGLPSLPRPEIAPDAPKALFFAPHPDDECIVGGLALRLMREARMNLVNVAVTQGSKKERQAERFRELQNACKYIGFGLIATDPNGLEKVNVKTRLQDPRHWSECVKVIADILATNQPRVIFFPHEHDWNSTHKIGRASCRERV